MSGKYLKEKIAPYAKALIALIAPLYMLLPYFDINIPIPQNELINILVMVLVALGVYGVPNGGGTIPEEDKPE